MTENTRDLSQFGYRELDLAADLLKVLSNPTFSNTAKNIELGDGLFLEFNPNSGYVFLGDEDGNTAMMNGERLENWVNCGDCGIEGFKSELPLNKLGFCKVCAKKPQNKN